MLTLASRLRALDDESLRRAIALRAVPAAGIRDFFDLAEALLEPDLVQRALSHLDRPMLAVLAVSGELRGAGTAAPTLEEIAARLGELTGSEHPEVNASAVALDELLLARLNAGRLAPYAAVSARLAAWPSDGLPTVLELAGAAPPSAEPPSAAADIRFTERMSAERAFATVSSVAELVNELSREPTRELSRGGLGLPDTKRLAAVMSVEIEGVAPLVEIAARAGVIARSDGYWMETVVGEEWLLEGTAHRWASLAKAWESALPGDVRSILPRKVGASWGQGLHDFVAWLYPAGDEWMAERVADYGLAAELIGVSANQITSTAGAALLSGDLESATATMATALPAEVGAVYLQHDLSIVAPGPLSPSIDARLRGLADVESRELASSYRITAASVNRALAAGENAESLLDFLRGISLTGIPQPVDYLIQESAARYGRVRVGTAPTAGLAANCYVRSNDAALLGTILVDQTLASLGLLNDNDRLISRFAVDAVFWALSDAKYPVAAENAAGEIVHLRRHRVARVVPITAVDPAATLVEKLRAGDGGEVRAASAWLARQLDIAIKAKQTVTVSIAMPGGVVVDYLLEPASVGGGRFRARDRRADIERTLPLSSIISITPAP